MNDQDLERLLKNAKPHPDKKKEAQHKEAALKAFRQTQHKRTHTTAPNRFYRHSWYGAIAASVFLVTGIYLFGSINPALRTGQPENIEIENTDQNHLKKHEKKQELAEADGIHSDTPQNNTDFSEIQEDERMLSVSRLRSENEADLFASSTPKPESTYELKVASKRIAPMSVTKVHPRSTFIPTSTQPSIPIPLKANNTAYETIQKSINNGNWPDLEAISEQEFLNAFNVELSSDMTTDQAVEIVSFIVQTPWRRESHLLYVFIKSQSLSEPSSGEIHFNPSIAQSYKLLAYGNPTFAKINSFVRVVVFEFKLTPSRLSKAQDLKNIAVVNLKPDQIQQAENRTVSTTIPNSSQKSIIESSELDFLSAAVGFIELLKKSDDIGEWDFSDVTKLSFESYKNNPSAQKEQFYRLVKKMDSIQSERSLR